MKTVERSRGFMLKLGLDEKMLTMKSWRVKFNFNFSDEKILV